MILNKKFIRNVGVFQGIGIIAFITTFLMNKLNKINPEDFLQNLMFFIPALLFVVAYYVFIHKTCIKNAGSKDWIVIGLITVIFCLPELLLSFTTAGVHFAIASIWGSTLLSVTVYSLINNLSQSQKKDTYLSIITILKVWVNFVYVGMFLYALMIVFFSNDFVFIRL